MSTLRIASYNFENLFNRAKLLNLQSQDEARPILEALTEFQELLKKETYSSTDKARILRLYQGQNSNDKTALKKWIDIEETRGKLFRKSGFAITGVAAGGKTDWNGVIKLKRAELKEQAITNTAKVVKAVNADIMCLVEVEDRPLMQNFRTDQLPNTSGFKTYNNIMVIDGNDPRGIDVGVMSRHPMNLMRSHADATTGNGRSKIFSRDCLEVEIILPGGESLWILCNHLKSKGYGEQAENDRRRKAQATRIAEILSEYDLSKEYVVVAGDLNDTPDSDPLKPLISVPGLHDVLELQFGTSMDERWTYHYKSNEQIDYLLISEALRQRFSQAGVERRGIHKVDVFSNGAIQPFNTITHWTHAASDHAAVWADFQF